MGRSKFLKLQSICGLLIESLDSISFSHHTSHHFLLITMWKIAYTPCSQRLHLASTMIYPSHSFKLLLTKLHKCEFTSVEKKRKTIALKYHCILSMFLKRKCNSNWKCLFLQGERQYTALSRSTALEPESMGWNIAPSF